MDIQSAPPPGASAPNTSVVGVPPQLGAPVPGTSSGLPAVSGLSIAQNPMAEALRSKGRGDDTMLVHMTPNEVNSLQGLALATGGSLTINPETGLPEAGWLGKLLPTILGAVGMAFGIPPVWMGAAGAVGGTIATGDLGKGLSMGLQAYGGASLGGAAGIAGKLGNVGGSLGLPGAAATMPSGATSAFKEAFGGMAAPSAATKTGLAGALQNFGTAAKAGLPGGIIGKAAPMLAAQGLIGGVSNAMTPSGGYATQDGKIDNSYQGPYYSPRRKIVSNATTESILKGSGEQQRWFDVAMPEVRNVQGQVVQPGSGTAPGTPILQNVLNPNAKKGQPMYAQQFVPYMMSPQEQQMAAMYPNIYGGRMGYAEGGEVQIADGGFVVDARTVSEAGNGFTDKGFTDFERLGGIPLKGPGDGVSDSIPARIGRDQPARVAAGEVYMPPEAVRRIGKGDEKRGAQKLYAMMDRAHQATKRGQKRNILKGLA